MVEVFEQVKRVHPHLRLLLVGDFEEGDPVACEVKDRIAGNSAIDRTGFTRDPWQHYRTMDLLLLTSYREGLPNVVLEAGVFSLPVVAYAATGTVDSLVEGESGLFARVGDVAGVASHVCRLIEDPGLTRRLGENLREHVVRQFNPERHWRRVAELYSDELPLATSGLPQSAKDPLRLSRRA